MNSRRMQTMSSWTLVIGLIASSIAASRAALANGQAASSAASAPQKPYKAASGPYSVSVIDEDWHDAARNRDIPVRIYLPRSSDTRGPDHAKPAGSAKLPVIVFSHGLWGSRLTYGYFGHHMASHGYIVINPTHAGSDTADLR